MAEHANTELPAGWEVKTQSYRWRNKPERYAYVIHFAHNEWPFVSSYVYKTAANAMRAGIADAQGTATYYAEKIASIFASAKVAV